MIAGIDETIGKRGKIFRFLFIFISIFSKRKKEEREIQGISGYRSLIPFV